MNITIENILLVGSILLLISILVGKTSYKFGVPTLILFLGVGMLAGTDGIAQIHFDNPKIAQFIGIVALNFILFNGGLETNYSSVKPILKVGLTLSTLGVFLTAILLGLFVYYVFQGTFTIYESLLLGSIVSSTDAAAVFSILRSKSLGLKHNLRPTLELESGSNDPMAYVLTIAMIQLVQIQDESIWSLVPLFFQQMLIGALSGIVFGIGSKYIINRIRLDFEGLYPILVIALMFIIFSGTDFIGGNGFLAIYIAGVFIGNQEIIHKKSILKMFDGLAWLMQIVLFVTLGLLVNPSEIIPIIGVGLLISLFLIIIARPVSVLLALIPFKMPMNARLYISWVGLRGAVPIVFATYPLIAGVEKAGMIFNIVFFISLTSVLIQGTTLGIIAKWLGVSTKEESKELNPTEALMQELPKTLMQEFVLIPELQLNGKKILELKFPNAAIIAMIKRGNTFITPNGSTEIEDNDTLIVLAENEDAMNEVRSILA